MSAEAGPAPRLFHHSLALSEHLQNTAVASILLKASSLTSGIPSRIHSFTRLFSKYGLPAVFGARFVVLGNIQRC